MSDRPAFTSGPWARDGLLIEADATVICAMGILAQSPYETTLPYSNDKANARLIAAAPAMYAALEAHAAWSWAERETTPATTFSERMELSKYSEWMTQRALDLVAGRDPDQSDYEGVPSLVVWPAVHLNRADADEAQAIVDRLIGKYRAALAAAKGGAA